MSAYPGEGSLSPTNANPKYAYARIPTRPVITRKDGSNWSAKAKAAYGTGNCRRCHTRNYPEYASTPLCDRCLDWEIEYLKRQNLTGGRDIPDGA